MIAEDIAFVRFRAPDLDQMAGFLADFGIATFESGGRLYGRGLGGAPFIHVTEPGEPGFAGLAFRMSRDDLARLSRHTGAAIVPFDEPGGGEVVRLTDPDGFAVEAIAGWEAPEPQPYPVTTGWNDARRKDRVRLAKRTGDGAAHVVRLGHCVLNVADFGRSEAWYKAHFGFLTSDEIRIDEDRAIGAFLRCDRGDQPTDHHTLFLVAGRAVGFNHAAYEVLDADDLFTGHELLKRQGRAAYWGIGRHVLGSQIFDYWRDPWGHTLEHWTDGDLFTVDDAARTATLFELLAVQWGHARPHGS